MNCKTCGHKLTVSEFIAARATAMMQEFNKKARYAVVGQDAYEELNAEFPGGAGSVTSVATPVGNIVIIVVPSPYCRKNVDVVPSAEEARYMKGSP